MRCYKVTAKEGDQVLGTRYAGTNALAKDAKEELMEKFGVKKSAVSVDGAEIPVAKNELLEFINGILKDADLVDGSSEYGGSE